MTRSFALSSIPLVLAVAACGPTGTPNTCTFNVQLNRHPGVFLGTGVPAAGGAVAVDVAATPTSCAVPTFTPDSWITITQQTPDHPETYVIAAAANSGGRRTGTASVGFQSLTVDQAGTGGSSCTFQLIPGASATFSSTGGTGAFVVVPSDQRCGWSTDRTSTGEDWSSEPRPLSGVGTMGVVFNVQSSTAAPQPPLPRQAGVTVRDSAAALVGTHQYQQQ
jgi:hypothetical protein